LPQSGARRFAHSIAPPMRKDYVRLVEIANEGARELGYKDTGALWRAKYDMPPDAFAAELDRLWGQALKEVTGQDKMDATAILDYFAPLKTWLDQQNQGQKCGW
jgi:hypothetical protein